MERGTAEESGAARDQRWVKASVRLWEAGKSSGCGAVGGGTHLNLDGAFPLVGELKHVVDSLIELRQKKQKHEFQFYDAARLVLQMEHEAGAGNRLSFGLRGLDKSPALP